jgi:hypothetical protein
MVEGMFDFSLFSEDTSLSAEKVELLKEKSRKEYVKLLEIVRKFPKSIKEKGAVTAFLKHMMSINRPIPDRIALSLWGSIKASSLVPSEKEFFKEELFLFDVRHIVCSVLESHQRLEFEYATQWLLIDELINNEMHLSRQEEQLSVNKKIHADRTVKQEEKFGKEKKQTLKLPVGTLESCLERKEDFIATAGAPKIKGRVFVMENHTIGAIRSKVEEALEDLGLTATLLRKKEALIVRNITQIRKQRERRAF